MSAYSFRNTPARKLAREMMELKAQKPPMISRLTRANSGIRNIYLKSKETGSSRDEIEEAGVLEQCEQVILPPTPGKSLCWLCGFPIEGIRVNHDPTNLYWSQYLDSAVCEHVLPVRLAGVITGLYYPHGGITTVGNEHLLHSVYEYSHHLCNLAKSDTWFLSKPNKSIPSYCDLVVNQEKIKNFLDYLLYYTVSPTGRYPVTYQTEGELLIGLDVDRHESGLFGIRENKAVRLYQNNVQYYISQYYRKNASDNDFERMVSEWKAFQQVLIEEKTNGLIEKIKEADGCGTSEEGRLYAATMSALTNLEQKGRVERIPGPSRAIFARSPSINRIAKSMKASRAENPAFFRSISPENIASILEIKPTGKNLLKRARTIKRKKSKLRRSTKRAKKERPRFLGKTLNKLKKIFLK